jgi:predicted Zn finger-like uncharacterized protein
MIIQCPACKARYRIDERSTDKRVVRVKCPKCSHGFEVNIDLPVAETSVKSRSIVVVDDARFFREVLVDILAPLEIPLQLAGTGEDGLKLIRDVNPVLVILDLKLPGMSGYELIKEIRADRSLAGIKILAMSSVYRQDDEVHKIILAGADEFLNKSFKPAHLLARVGQLLGS